MYRSLLSAVACIGIVSARLQGPQLVLFPGCRCPDARYCFRLHVGEPKSGTTFMYHWAHGALIRTCNFLNKWFGDTSCHLTTGRYRGLFHTPEEVSMSFDPRRGGDDAKCSCDGVDR